MRAPTCKRACARAWQAALEATQPAAQHLHYDARLQAFLESRRERVRIENGQLDILRKAQKQFADDEVEQAFRTLSKLQSESAVRAGAEEFIETVRAACERRLLGRAGQLQTSRDWDSCGRRTAAPCFSMRSPTSLLRSR